MQLYTAFKNKTPQYLVSVRHQPPDMDKQTVRGDAARHEVVIQMTEDVQLLCGDLFGVKSDINIPSKELPKKKQHYFTPKENINNDCKYPLFMTFRASACISNLKCTMCDALSASPLHPLRRTCTCNRTPQPTVHLCAAFSAG